MNSDCGHATAPDLGLPRNSPVVTLPKGSHMVLWGTKDTHAGSARSRSVAPRRRRLSTSLSVKTERPQLSRRLAGQWAGGVCGGSGGLGDVPSRLSTQQDKAWPSLPLWLRPESSQRPLVRACRFICVEDTEAEAGWLASRRGLLGLAEAVRQLEPPTARCPPPPAWSGTIQLHARAVSEAASIGAIHSLDQAWPVLQLLHTPQTHLSEDGRANNLC